MKFSDFNESYATINIIIKFLNNINYYYNINYY